LKSGSLKLLDPSGPVQACNGISLSLIIIKFGSCTMKIFDGFTTKDSYTWNIAQYRKYCSVKLEA